MRISAAETLISIARASGAPSATEPLNLGQRVRDLRKARGWTPHQAAVEAGLARSTPSRIENGQMSPTCEALKKKAVGPGISVPQLFTPPAKAVATDRRAVTKTGDGQTLATATYEHELLASVLSPKRMLPYHARIRTRRIEEFDGWVRHDGEEFLLVLAGAIRLYSEFCQPVDLRRGDIGYYGATMGHNVISLSDEDATILWVTSLA